MSAFGGLQPSLRPWAQRLLSSFPGLHVTSVRRSRATQTRLWNNRHRNPYPVAPPGQSLHEYGLAFDLVGDPDQLAAAGRVWNSWGGHWSSVDRIHFEVRP
jgi:hypothetical protein